MTSNYTDVGINLPLWRNKIVFDDVVPVRMTFIHNKIRGIITIDHPADCVKEQNQQKSYLTSHRRLRRL